MIPTACGHTWRVLDIAVHRLIDGHVCWACCVKSQRDSVVMGKYTWSEITFAPYTSYQLLNNCLFLSNKMWASVGW